MDNGAPAAIGTGKIEVPPKKKQRSDAGKPRKKPDAKTPAAALIDVMAALDGLDNGDMIRVLKAAHMFYDLEEPLDREGI